MESKDAVQKSSIPNLNKDSCSAGASTNVLDISQLLSNLPSGWKIVGLTDLSNLSQGNVTEVNKSEPARLGSCLPPTDNSENRNSNKETSSRELGSAAQISKSLSLGEIPIIKSEINQDQFSQDDSSAKSSKPIEVPPPNLSATDQQWTIVGITSIPPSSPSASVVSSVAGAPLPTCTAAGTPLSSVSSSTHKTEHSSISQFSKGEIKTVTPLNMLFNNQMPIPKLLENHTHVTDKSITQASVLNSIPSTSLPPEEMKWTVVGITGSLPSTDVPKVMPTFRLSSDINCNVRGQGAPSESSAADSKVNSQIDLSIPRIPGVKTTDFDTLNRSGEKSEWKVVGITSLDPNVPKVVGITSLDTNVPFNTTLPHVKNELVCPKSPLETAAAVASALPPVSPVSPQKMAQAQVETQATSLLNHISRKSSEAVGNTFLPTNLTPSTAVNESTQQAYLRLLQNPLLSANSAALMDPANKWSVVGLVANNNQLLQDTFKPVPTTLRSHDSSSYFRNTQMSESENLVSSSSSLNYALKNKKIANILLQQRKFATLENSAKGMQIGSYPASCIKKEPRAKCKDLVRKSQSNKMSKNTVSALLMMQRMERGERDMEDSSGCYGTMDDCESLVSSSGRQPKSRSLRSYAGNRKLFQRPPQKPHSELEKINLRSGTQVPVFNYDSEEEKDEDCNCAASCDSDVPYIKEEHIHGENDKSNEDLGSDQGDRKTFGGGGRSSSNKRKSKVPRKMVRDVDYHPFHDSSSDSN